MLAVAGSRGSAAASTLSRIAASRTVRVNGPAVSWLWAIGIIPARLTSPTVGLTVTRPFWHAGDNSEPEVSVPIAAAASPAATAAADPELDPPGDTIGTPRSSSCGA